MNSAFFFVSLFTVFTFLRPQEFLTWINFPLLSILMALALASYLGVKDKNLSTPIHKYIFSFLVIVVIGCFLSNPSAALTRSWDFFFNIILPVTLLSNLIVSIEKQKHLMFWLVMAGGFIAHHSIGQYFSPTRTGWTGLECIWREDKKLWQVLWFGILSDPNDLGQFFLFIIPFAVFLFSQASSIFIKLILLVNFGLIMVATFVANSRGTVMGLLAMLGFWFYRKYGAFKTAVATFAASPLLLLIASSGGQISSEDKSANQRLDAWIQGFFMLRDHILFGVGKDGFVENHTKTAHNSIVLAYAETGILGYLMWMSMIYATLAWLYKLSGGQAFSDENINLHEKIKEERVVAATILYSLLGILVSAFFISRTYSLVLFLSVAFTMAQIVRFENLIPNYKFKFKWYKFIHLSIFIIMVITIYSFRKRV